MTESRKECSYVKKSNAKKNILELQIAQICAGKNEIIWFLSNKKSSYSHFHLSILLNISQVLIFLKVLCSSLFY